MQLLNKLNPTALPSWSPPAWLFTALMAVFSFGAVAQTDRIPIADGAFSNGATFALNGWTVSNSANNPWAVGSGHALGAPFAGDAAYVTNTGTYSYSNTAQCVNYFWRDVTVPAGETAMTLTFNWNQTGEASWDLWQVFVAPTSITPAGVATHPGSGTNNVPSGILGATYVANGSVLTGIQSFSGTIPGSFAGQTFRLIFAWKSDTS
ncbi:MAG: hypothetical protein ACKOW8_09545, partial [Flavobacteriales bacterium]